MTKEIRVLGEISAKNFTTSNYSVFKRLPGNRLDAERRAKAIMKSIREDGYAPTVITVNENMEIIDGQARELCCETLGLPVTYSILKGANIETCRILNKTVSPWRLIDYIESGAELGDQSYVWLRALIREYHKDLHLKAIFCAIAGTASIPRKAIVDGSFEMTEEIYDKARKALDYLLNFQPFVVRAQGHQEFYHAAILFCFKDPEIDSARLLKKATEFQASFIPVVTTEQAFGVLEPIYNNRLAKKVYISTDYKKYIESRRRGYNDD